MNTLAVPALLALLPATPAYADLYGPDRVAALSTEVLAGDWTCYWGEWEPYRVCLAADGTYQAWRPGDVTSKPPTWVGSWQWRQDHLDFTEWTVWGSHARTWRVDFEREGDGGYDPDQLAGWVQDAPPWSRFRIVRRREDNPLNHKGHKGHKEEGKARASSSLLSSFSSLCPLCPLWFNSLLPGRHR